MQAKAARTPTPTSCARFGDEAGGLGLAGVEGVLGVFEGGFKGV